MKPVAKSEGLTFSLRESESEKQPGLGAFALGACVSALLFFGIAGSLYTLVETPAQLEVLIPLGLAASIALFACWAYKKVRIPGFALLVVALAAWFLLMQGDMINGFNLVATQVGDMLSKSTGLIFPLYDISVSEGGYAMSVTLFLIPVCLLLALLCSFLTFYSSVVITLAIAAIVLAASAVLDQPIGPWPFVSLVLAVLLIACTSFGSRRFFQGRFSKGPLQIGIGVACLCVMVVATAWFAASPDGYEQPEMATQVRSSAERAIDSSRFGRDSGLGMPDGDFYGLGNLELSDETALEVTMEIPESFWLRGYVGSEYTGNGWEQDDPNKLHESKDLFFWLHDDGFYGQTQLADSAAVSGKLDAWNNSRVSVNNVRASSRNIYAPYETYWANEDLMRPDGIGDGRLYSQGWSGVRSYNYSVVPNQVKQFPWIISAFGELEQNPNSQMSNYLAVEGYYANFAKEMYSEVNEDLQGLMERLLPRDEIALTFNDAKQAILNVLSGEVSYSEEIAPLAPTEDFIESFLSNTGEGYSVHYASAGTLMFRHLGFPARYVEGYLITPTDVEGLSNYSVLALDGTHAHAWTEVYLDAVGWVPVELTPAYLNVMEQADTLQGVSAAGGPSEDGTENEDGERDPALENQESSPDVELIRASFPWELVALAVLLLVVAATAFIIHRVAKRKRLMEERARLFESDDNAKAITAMFHYCMDILSALGLSSREVLRLDPLLPRVEHVVPACAEGFTHTFELYEEAAYSKHEMTLEGRAKVANYKDCLVETLRERSKGLEGLRVRFILFLL